MDGDNDVQMGATQDPPAEENELAQLFMEANQSASGGGKDFWDDLNTRALDVGEKAEDAIDYEDISDDDLPEEEEADDAGQNGRGPNGTNGQDLFGDGYDHDDDMDDLFGGSSPIAERSHQENIPVTSIETSQAGTGADAAASGDGARKTQQNFRNVRYGDPEEEPQEEDDDDPEWKEQLALFQKHRRGHDDRLPSPPRTSQDVFQRIWPDFEPDKPPRFASLIPRKRAQFVPRVPLKLPKPLQITKVSLEIAQDQEKAFRLPATDVQPKTARQLEEDQGGIVRIIQRTEEEKESNEEVDQDDIEVISDHEKIGNVSFGDLKIACEDWDVPSIESLSDQEDLLTPPDTFGDSEDWIRDLAMQPIKRRKLGERERPVKFSVYDHMDLPSWDDPELATAKLSKKIILDMNDPHLLLDIQQPSAEQSKPRTTGLGLKRDNRGSLANPMFKRYNISNDEAYDALKENSQQKVRSNLGHLNVEHSLPALKLQYPFYKVNLNDRELRSFHRPMITFKAGERAGVSPLKSVKRKHKKNQKPSEAFAVAEDLNVGDNSDLLLAEYSEECPTTLSNFGMGTKILNYYRRKDNDDTSRPKLELGETSVLLPQDKSPFSLFGTVNPGETVPTLHNAMYRAPVFQHSPASTDFLVSRSTTGVHGSKYYIRNLQNLVVVGQQFPSVEVPGTHARKVTEASKKRLKMLAFRMYRRGQQRGLRQPWVSNEMIKHHLPGTEIAQNRSRMREIMKYDKNTGTWEPMPGETIPDEPTLRTWIKPEDICLIDSMHAGDKQLQDAGINSSDIKDDDDGEDGEQMELKLAPWHTTKNFLNACAGKAMLELHGEGDPTGRGEGYSFIKVSMKGGFKDIGESTADKMDAKKQKELGGHSYNVQRQQAQYENAIQRIWKKQADALGSVADHDDVDMDDDDEAEARPTHARGRSEVGTPALLRGDDDTMSQFSRNSGNDTRGKKLKIKRTIRNDRNELETQVVTVTNPEVIKLYVKHKKQEQLLNMKIDDIKPTGNAEFDKQQILKLKAEAARIQRNIERRQGREKAKGINTGPINGEGGSVVGGGKGSGATPRKCANCGEVGHIKTNKKYVSSFRQWL